jgi:hypothetical protein
MMARSKKSATRRSSGGRWRCRSRSRRGGPRTACPGSPIVDPLLLPSSAPAPVLLPIAGEVVAVDVVGACFFSPPPLLSVWIRLVRASPPLLSAWIRPVRAAPRSSPVTVVAVTPELTINLPVVARIELLLCARRRRSSLRAPRVDMRQPRRRENTTRCTSAGASVTMHFGHPHSAGAPYSARRCENVTSATQ